MLETVKPAEDGNGIIIRVIEEKMQKQKQICTLHNE